jgi:hypothetical protein
MLFGDPQLGNLRGDVLDEQARIFGLIKMEVRRKWRIS